MHLFIKVKEYTAHLRTGTETEISGLHDPIRANNYMASNLEAMGLSHLWDSKEKIARIILYLESLCIDTVLAKQHATALAIIISIKAVEETKSLRGFDYDLVPHNNTEEINRWVIAQSVSKRFVSDCCGDPAHRTTKFVASRSNCSCLNEIYTQLKSGPKMGMCFSPFCHKKKKRAQLMTCQQCGTIEYCSKACQVRLCL
jgi:hypothetical protein